MRFPRVTFLKLGGSLITDKDQPETALIEQINDLLTQIADWHLVNPDDWLLLGHGSGSFGHHAAAQFGTRQGINGVEGAWVFNRFGTVPASSTRSSLSKHNHWTFPDRIRSICLHHHRQSRD